MSITPVLIRQNDITIYGAEFDADGTTSSILIDLAPSDFNLFGYVQQFLSECQFANQDSLLQAVSNILVGIKK
jgi:hypothetical protein